MMDDIAVQKAVDFLVGEANSKAFYNFMFYLTDINKLP